MEEILKIHQQLAILVEANRNNKKVLNFIKTSLQCIIKFIEGVEGDYEIQD